MLITMRNHVLCRRTMFACLQDGTKVRRGVSIWGFISLYWPFLVVLIVLLVMTEVFIIEWRLLEVNEYLTFVGCNESIFNTDCNEKSCLREDISSTSQSPELFHHSIIANRSCVAPIIQTKCGTTTARLISDTCHFPDGVFASQLSSIPNIVHYVFLGQWEFSFLNYLSVKSVHLHIKPLYIVIHGDNLPYGEWWLKTLREISNIYFAHRNRPVRIQGIRVPWIEHSSDILRIQTIYDNGGIYLDTDVLALKTFDRLRHHPVTLGQESSYGLGSSIIIGQRRAPFLCMWLHRFSTYRPFLWNWAKYAVWNPFKLSKQYPDLVHIEKKSLLYPSWAQPELLFNQQYNWSDNYAMHIWHRYGSVPRTPDCIQSLNTTLGSLMRFIYEQPL